MGTPPKPCDTSRSELPERTAASPSTGSRRRFIGATAGGVGVLLAVQARSALGGTCLSPSALVSGNLSHPADGLNCTGGLSPTVWKLQGTQGQMANPWPAGFTAPTFNTTLTDSTGCNGGHDIANPKDVIAVDLSGNPMIGTPVDQVLPGAPGNTGIWEVLAFPDFFTSPSGELMSHLLAAWFNALAFPGYPVKTWHISEMWEALKGGGTYCPSNLACNTDMGLTTSDVIAYLTTTYDLTSGLVAVCTTNGSSLSSDGNIGTGKKK